VQIKQQLLDSKALSVAFEAKKVVASYPVLQTLQENNGRNNTLFGSWTKTRNTCNSHIHEKSRLHSAADGSSARRTLNQKLTVNGAFGEFW
jgi:hypothetical protein